MKDLYHNVSVSQLAAPAVATSTVTSSALDLQGYDSASVAFAVGASGDTLSGSIYWTLKLRHSDNNSDYEDVDTTGLLSASATVVIDASNEDETLVVFGYKGGKRYVKAVATATGTHSNGTPMAIVGLKGHASIQPVS